MTLNGVMAVAMRYLTEFGSFPYAKPSPIVACTTKSVTHDHVHRHSPDFPSLRERVTAL